MTIESFINDGTNSQPIGHILLNQIGSGHLYTSYPEGPGKFTALVVECTGPESAIVHEIADGNNLDLGFDASALPEGTLSTKVTGLAPFEKKIVAPNGSDATLIVRCVGAVTLN